MRTVGLIGSVALLILLGGIWAGSAAARAPIDEFTVTPSNTQAGGHPDIQTVITVQNTMTQDLPAPDCRCHDTRTINIDVPAGIVPDVHAAPQCTSSDFSTNYCPIDTQIGYALIAINDYVPGQIYSYPIPVLNLVPHPNQAGLLGFYAPFLESPIYIVASARTEGDYGLSLTTAEITHLAGFRRLDMTLWGVPADPANDPLRLGPPGCNSQGTSPGRPPCQGGEPANSPLRPFISNPTTCGTPLSSFLEVLAYDQETTTADNVFPVTTGCDQLSFNPSLFGQPTTSEGDSPSGFDIDLKVPQNVSPSTPSPSQIKATTVTLPEGFSINANAADGKTSCSEAQANFDDRSLAAECPQFSKVGTLAVSSSSLPGPLPGYIYVTDPKPGDRFRLLLVADGFGLHVKLPGSAVPDPQTGRLTVSFLNLPQFPFTDFNMHFFGSERGLLATPVRCGTYSVDSTFTPWDSALPDQSSKQFFRIDSGPHNSPCPGAVRPFSPGFEAGVADKTAGAHAPFSLRVTREDGEQNLTGIDVATPPGFAATLKGIPYCPEAAIARLQDPSYTGLAEQVSPTCPLASQVGTVTAGAGAGSRPLHVTGRVYLAGPYKGAPLSLEAVIPGMSGPYDLGVVAGRTALRVDPVDAHVSAVSDPLPQILGGVPLRTRSIQIDLDRQGFALNPTNCDPFSVAATIHGGDGTAAARSSHFQVADCASLRYRPKLSLKLSGGVKRRGHPAIKATFTAQPGEANTQSVSVALPAGELLDNARIGTVCTRGDFAKDTCPAGSLLGRAEATTPLLDTPLTGNVYLRSNPQHELPDLVMDLEGQIDVELAGRIDTGKGGALRTTFETVPDAPVSSFVLTLSGGSKGLVQNSASLCGARKRAKTVMTGQNGVVVRSNTTLQVACGAGARHKRNNKGGRA